MRKINILLITGFFIIIFNSSAFGSGIQPSNSDKIKSIISDPIKNVESAKNPFPSDNKTLMGIRNYDRYRYQRRPRRIEHEFDCTFSVDGDTYYPNDKSKRWGVSASYRILIGN